MYWLPVILILPYFCLLLRIYRNLRRIKPYNPDNGNKTFISVVVACRNEEKNLPSMLYDISVQDYDPGLFELILVDDNSEDGTFKQASEFRGIRNYKVIQNDGIGKKQAIRTGIKLCSGDLIITTDADCRMGSAWISTIASFFERRRPEMIIGPVVLTSRTGFINRFQELEFMGLQGVTAGTAAAGDPVMCNGANLAFTKATYIKHADKLKDELNTGDDIFLLHSLKTESGSKILWLESNLSLVTARSSRTPAEFLQQRARWLSKARAYRDKSTILIGIVTFVTILLLCSVLVTGLFVPEFLPVFLVILLLKSIPDTVILRNTIRRYGKGKLMKWFIPSQLVYPFYVLAVVLRLVLTPERVNLSSPSPKGI